MLAPQTYVCDHCDKTYHEKRLLIEMELGNISQNGQLDPDSGKTIHLCNTNKCKRGFMDSLCQPEYR